MTDKLSDDELRLLLELVTGAPHLFVDVPEQPDAPHLVRPIRIRGTPSAASSTPTVQTGMRQLNLSINCHSLQAAHQHLMCAIRRFLLPQV